MALSRWITNIESADRMAKATAEAYAALSANDTPITRRAWETAKFKEADVAHTMKRIALEHPRHTLGEPLGTEFKTAEAIAAEGIIGVYKEGAGDGT